MKRFTPQEVQNAEVIFVSHSGGKDSQAMLAQLKRVGYLGKIVLVHSNLGEMEWEEMKPWIEKNSFGLKCHVVKSEMNFFDVARKYKRLPSGMNQFCTDFLKTKPIAKFIHNYMYERGYKTAINATGMRSDESRRRALKLPIQKSKMTQPRKHPDHLIHDWLPIFNYSVEDVYQEIAQAGQSAHPIYKQGFSRLSCVICVNGRISEHKKAVEMRPKLAKKMSDLEKELGKTIRLKQIKGIKYPKYLVEYTNIIN